MWFFQSISNRITLIDDRISNFTVDLSGLNDPTELLTVLKDSMEDIVADALENIQPPSAFDHIAGAVGQMIQMKMMKSMDMMPPILSEGLNALVDDEPL